MSARDCVCVLSHRIRASWGVSFKSNLSQEYFWEKSEPTYQGVSVAYSVEWKADWRFSSSSVRLGEKCAALQPICHAWRIRIWILLLVSLMWACCIDQSIRHYTGSRLFTKLHFTIMPWGYRSLNLYEQRPFWKHGFCWHSKDGYSMVYSELLKPMIWGIGDSTVTARWCSG